MHAEHAELISALRIENRDLKEQIKVLNREHKRIERDTATGALIVINDQAEMILIQAEMVQILRSLWTTAASCP